jgi:hypothetical protein
MRQTNPVHTFPPYSHKIHSIILPFEEILLFPSLYLTVVRVIKSRRIRWVGHTALVEEMLNAYKILIGYRLEDLKEIGFIRKVKEQQEGVEMNGNLIS